MSVKSRRDRLARALRLNTDMQRLEAMRLAQIEAKLSELKSAEHATLLALEQGLLEPTFLLARLRNLTTQKAEAERAYQAQLERAQAQARRAKLTEKLYEQAEDARRRDKAAAELRSVLEGLGVENVRAP